MNGKHYVGKRVSSFTKYDDFGPITGIALVIDENNEYLAGDQNGYVLEVECPYGTQAMASNMLASLKGKIYKGYRAENAIMSPQAELGDGVTISGTYSMLAYRSVEFGPGHMSEIAAPGENELNHEYQYVSPTQRKIDRKIAETRSSITKTAEEIRMEIANEMQGLSASFDLKLGQLSASLTDSINGLSAEWTLRYDGLTTRFENELQGLSAEFSSSLSGVDFSLTDRINGLSSEFIQSIDGITTRVNGLDGQMSSITHTLDGITQRVQGLDGQYSSLEQTVSGITARVNGLDGRYSSLEQYVDSLTLSVSNGSTSSTIALKAGDTTISSQNITFSGFVTFTGLSGGTTTIDGACIKTGTIDADRLNLTGAITFSDLSSSLYNQVNNSITSSQAKTLINSTLVSSPNIAGGKFSNLDQTTWIEIESGFGHYGLVLKEKPYWESTPIFGVFNGDGAYVSLEAKGADFLTVEAERKICHPYGTWDFSKATVTGVSTLSLATPEEKAQKIDGTNTEPLRQNPVQLSDENGALKIKLPDSVWYLDATGLHQ